MTLPPLIVLWLLPPQLSPLLPERRVPDSPPLWAMSAVPVDEIGRSLGVQSPLLGTPPPTPAEPFPPARLPPAPLPTVPDPLDAGVSPEGDFVALPQPRRRRRQDRWFSEDKVKHFAMAFFTVGVTQSAARVAGMDADAALALGVGAGVLASIGKEWYDRNRNQFGVFSYRDLVWDTAGMALAVAILRKTR